MSFGTRWTKEDIAMLSPGLRKALDAGPTASSLAKLGKAVKSTAPLSIKTIAPKKRELMNRTEKLWFSELQRREYKIILCQAITFRLGDRMTYRPDFVTVEAFGSYGTVLWLGDKIKLTCYETKAPHRFKAAGVTKLKAAAAIYPWIKFVLVERNKSQWSERTIGQ